MYGISTYVCHKNQPSVGKYTIHGSYKYRICWCMEHLPMFSINLYTKLGTNATNQSIIGFQPSPLNHATRIKPSQVIHHWCPLLLKNLHRPPRWIPQEPKNSLLPQSSGDNIRRWWQTAQRHPAVSRHRNWWHRPRLESIHSDTRPRIKELQVKQAKTSLKQWQQNPWLTLVPWNTDSFIVTLTIVYHNPYITG